MHKGMHLQLHLELHFQQCLELCLRYASSAAVLQSVHYLEKLIHLRVDRHRFSRCFHGCLPQSGMAAMFSHMDLCAAVRPAGRPAKKIPAERAAFCVKAALPCRGGAVFCPDG